MGIKLQEFTDLRMQINMKTLDSVYFVAVIDFKVLKIIFLNFQRQENCCHGYNGFHV